MQKHREWLWKELPALEEEGVLSPYYAQALREHYPLDDDAAGAHEFPVTVLLGVLGAFLVGGGLILLLGHNWNELSRFLRTILVFFFLLVSQAYAGWVLWRRRRSVAARETAAVLNVCFTAAAIALIGQTYHIPGDLTAFLQVWMLLTLPVIYLLSSVATVCIYLAGISAWAVSFAAAGGTVSWFWAFYAALLPFAVVRLRTYRERPGAASCLAWGLCLHALAIGVFLEADLPGLWILLYTSLFASMHLAGVMLAAQPGLARAFGVVGRLGGLVLAFLLTNEWAWSMYSYGSQWDISPGTAVDLLLWAVFTVATVGLMVRVLRKGLVRDAVEGIAPVIALLVWAAVQYGAPAGLAMLAFNAYLVALGVFWLTLGIREARLGRMNAGMALLMALLLLRFFDSDIPMVARGVVYMLLGLSVWGVNLFMQKKRRKAGLI